MPAPIVKKPHGLRYWLGLKRVLFLNMAVFLLLAWALYGEAVRDDSMEVEIKRLQEQSEELATKNSELAELGKRLSDPQMLEKEARLKLNMQKPGEEVVVITGGASSDAEAEALAMNEEPQMTGTNTQKWWRYFFR